MLRQLAVFILALTAPMLSAGEPDSGIDKTWFAFQGALHKNSPEALARISKFPIVSNEFGGDIKTPDVLKVRFGKIFTPKTIQCLLAQKPKRIVSGTKVYFEAFCDSDVYPISYSFKMVGSEFRFTGIDNINE